MFCLTQLLSINCTIAGTPELACRKSHASVSMVARLGPCGHRHPPNPLSHDVGRCPAPPSPPLSLPLVCPCLLLLPRSLPTIVLAVHVTVRSPTNLGLL